MKTKMDLEANDIGQINDISSQNANNLLILFANHWIERAEDGKCCRLSREIVITLEQRPSNIFPSGLPNPIRSFSLNLI